MTKLYVTIEVDAKDKLEAASIVRKIVEGNPRITGIIGISGTNPYED